MTRRALAIYTTAAALTFAPALVFAQDDLPKTQGARPNPSGSSSGSASPRPSGGSSGGSSSGTMSTPSGGSSRPAGPVAGGGSRPSNYEAPSAPQRRPQAGARPRSEAPRGEAPSATGGSSPRRVAPPAASTPSTVDRSDDRRRAVPAYSRPRDGRPVTGTAIDRRLAPRPGFDINNYIYYYNRYPRGYYWPGYGLGVGYFYDPWMWGYFSPYGYADPYYYGGGYGYSHGYSRYRDSDYRPLGSIRLKVKPEFGQVYVDGYYVGEVDQFDGVFQRLKLEEGAHRVEVRAEGFETVQFEVMVIPGETVTYKGELKRIE